MNSSATVKPDVRRTNIAKVSRDTWHLFKQRFDALIPQLSAHYDVELSRTTDPQFLVYRRGDFFRRHADKHDHPDLSERVRQRKISLVLFVNGNNGYDPQDIYKGGALTLYNLIDHPVWHDRGLPIDVRPGDLITFPSEMVHEVTTIESGERCTIVAWYS